MTKLDLEERPRIVSHLQHLIMLLHDLFYPKVFHESFVAKARTYNTEVTTQMVQNVCKSVYPDLVN